jgi:DNA-binding MarR family transcriptional regulator
VNTNTPTPSSAAPADTTPATPGVAFYSAQGYQPDESVGYLMRRILALLNQGIEREMEPSGLTNAQWGPILRLYWGHASTVAELARCSDHDAGSMTRLLDRLEAKELCQRVRSTDDRRVVNIELTPSGVTAAQEIPAILSKVQNEYLAGFSEEEWKTLKGYLRRILDTAQALQPAKEKHDL